MIKKFLKDQRGLTLIELLAVVVILGIISAIAVPSIGALIDNSKKDAHVANARQMINSAKMAVSAGAKLPPTTTTAPVTIKLSEIQTLGYIDPIKDPDGGTYNTDSSDVKITLNGDNTYTYSVKLITSATTPRGVQTAATNGAEVDEGSLDRTSVK